MLWRCLIGTPEVCALQPTATMSSIGHTCRTLRRAVTQVNDREPVAAGVRPLRFARRHCRRAHHRVAKDLMNLELAPATFTPARCRWPDHCTVADLTILEMERLHGIAVGISGVTVCRWMVHAPETESTPKTLKLPSNTCKAAAQVLLLGHHSAMNPVAPLSADLGASRPVRPALQTTPFDEKQLSQRLGCRSPRVFH